MISICERKKSVKATIKQAETSQPPQDQADEEDSDGPFKSYELDDDNENLLFSHELRRTPMPNHFIPSKIPIYERRDDSESTSIPTRLT